MDDDRVGYGRPPKQHRFRKGVCPNPLGRGRRKEHPITTMLFGFLNEVVEYREGGKLKRASRAKLSVQRLIASALSGDLKAANNLLTLRRHGAQHSFNTDVIRVIVEGGLPQGYLHEPDYTPPADA